MKTDKCDGGTDDVCFQGHLDGGDHIISNLYLNISGSGDIYGGLFGYTGSRAEISNMGLTDASVTVASTTAYSYGGGLVGYNYQGTVSYSYATGEVTASSSSSRSYGGGLVGYNYQGTVSYSYATGEVTASSSSSSYSGGLVGYNWGTVRNSYATGEVTSSASFSYSGGLAGFCKGTISNSYATGEVTASSSSSSYSGGLVGRHSIGGTISNSYATGAVTASTTALSTTAYGGGFVGNNIGTISGTNYFVHNSGGTNGLGSGSCSGTCTKKTLAELQALTSADVTDWSTDDWDFGTTTQLPRLK